MLVKDKNDLYAVFKNKLIAEKLISNTDTIYIKKIHPIRQQNGEIIHHYHIIINNKRDEFLIRTVKEKDYSCIVMKHLIELNNSLEYIHFPHALAEPFTVGEHTYIITTYIEGFDLETQIQQLSKNELLDISEKLETELSLIHSVNNEQYSNGKQFGDISFAQIMFNNIQKQFENTQNIFAKYFNICKLLDRVYTILAKSDYSQPTLIHMDIKPANIIISPQKQVYLIDFELSRFGDLDYEWTNMLIKILHAYDMRFKEYVLNPIIENNFMSLEKAISTDKYKVYLLYLSVNKYLYCLNRKCSCPKALIDLSYSLMSQLS